MGGEEDEAKRRAAAALREAAEAIRDELERVESSSPIAHAAFNFVRDHRAGRINSPADLTQSILRSLFEFEAEPPPPPPPVTQKDKP